MSKSFDPSARELVLDAAEQLFASRGYVAVTLKDIADQLGMKQASLYYHVPGGKEDLFVEVMLRHLERRRKIMQQIILMEPQSLKDSLTRVGNWLLSQPPLNAIRMIRSDLPELGPEKASHLEQEISRCIYRPVEEIFTRYQHQLRGDASFIGGTFLAAVEALHTFKRYGSRTEGQLIENIVDLLLHGALTP